MTDKAKPFPQVSLPLTLFCMLLALLAGFMAGNSILPPSLVAQTALDARTAADKLAHRLNWQPIYPAGTVNTLAAALMKLRRAFNWDLKINARNGR